MVQLGPHPDQFLNVRRSGFLTFWPLKNVYVFCWMSGKQIHLMKGKTSYPYLQSIIPHSGSYFDFWLTGSHFVDINSSAVSPGTLLFESRGGKKFVYSVIVLLQLISVNFSCLCHRHTDLQLCGLPGVQWKLMREVGTSRMQLVLS